MCVGYFDNIKNVLLQDEKDLTRGTRAESTTGTELDDYLHPNARGAHGTSASTASGSLPQTPVKPFWSAGSSMTSDGSCAPQNRHNWNQELSRCTDGTTENSHDAGTGTLVSDGSTRRYCSDPLNMLKDDSEDCFDSGTSKSRAQVGSLKLELPVDEDDYLMPSPQQVPNGTAYIDLIGDSKHGDVPYRGAYPDFLPTVDNPEYIMSQESAPTQTLGIPTTVVVDPVETTDADNSTGDRSYQPQRSSEEESDHEYYNDFDRLRRELQPLRKSETTV